MSSGTIYGIKLAGNKEVRYIGMTTKDIKQRMKEHKKAARLGKGYPVYDWIRKHGEDNIEIFIVEKVVDSLETREIYWIDYYKKQGSRLLNLTDGGSGPNGHVWTKEQRERHSLKMKEVVNRPEVAEKIKKNRPIVYGRKHSEEQKKKWSEQRKGSITGEKNPNYRKFGPAHPSYGRKLSEETKQRLSEQKRGKNNPNYGKPLSEETRKKLSVAQKGKPKPKSARSAHTRYHVNRNGFSDKCKYCLEEKND
jgi:group I intron endonuclease